MGRKPKLRGHGFRPSQNYSVQEIAEKLGMAETTVREWIRHEKLPAMTSGNPHLVLGADISAFLVSLRDKKQRLAPDEFKCMHCREPRKAYGGMADFTVTNGRLGALKALCEVCGGTVSRGVSVRGLSRLKAIFDIRE
jgi:excisionase family DNA binding protein